MRFEFEEAKDFRAVVKGLKLLFDEATFTLDSGGLRVQQLDPPHVFMVRVRIPNDSPCFSGDVRFTVSLNDMLAVLKRIYAGDVVILEVGDEDIMISLKGDLCRIFKVPRLGPAYRGGDPPTPMIRHTATLKTTAKTLERIILDAREFSQYTDIRLYDDEAVFLALGDRTGYKVELDQHNDHVLELDVEECARASYSNDYLMDFIKFLKPLSPVVDLSLADDKPMKLEGRSASGIEITFWLAPYVEP